MQADAVASGSSARAASDYRGFWPWLLQRLSGLLLAIFLAFHIVTLHFLRQREIDVLSVAERFRDITMIKLFYVMFLIVVVFHAFNGVRGIVMDHTLEASRIRLMRAIVWIAGIATTVYGLLVLHALSELL